MLGTTQSGTICAQYDQGLDVTFLYHHADQPVWTEAVAVDVLSQLPDSFFLDEVGHVMSFGDHRHLVDPYQVIM